ncbi:hypothetical protein HDU79_002209 [Rhizoclosmatium sp. JEL0117]|nr:hypothetical protein HDU79_002209 [Rhizoclosmatium sp. JEL0117]
MEKATVLLQAIAAAPSPRPSPESELSSSGAKQSAIKSKDQKPKKVALSFVDLTGDDDDEGGGSHKSLPPPLPAEIEKNEIGGGRRTITKSIASIASTAKHSVASSKNSGMAFEEDTMMAKLVKALKKWNTGVLESDFYAFYRRVVDDSRNQILVIALFQLAVFGSIFYVIKGVLGSVIPEIRFYNLIHVTVAFQGRLLIEIGSNLAGIIKKGFAAVDMSAHKKGVPITEIADVDPPACRQIIRVYMICLSAIELSLWALSFFVNWQPVDTYVGTYPCSYLSYNSPWNFTAEFETWVGANMEFAKITTYGLPLVSGLIGGSCATPSKAPARDFEMEGPAVLFLINAVCVDPVVVEGPPTTTTTSKITSSEYFGSMFTFTLHLKFPAGTHNVKSSSNFDITQNCQVNVVTGIGHMTMSYRSDSWNSVGSIVPTTVQEIIVGTTTLNLDNSQNFDFGLLHNQFGTSQHFYQNITKWISDGTNLLLNNDNMKAIVTRGVTAQVFSWGVSQEGLYDPARTWKGVASAVGVISHYVLDKSDGSSSAMCDYKGAAGAGKIQAPDWSILLSTILLICGVVLEVIVVLSWILAVGGGHHINRCVAMIGDPLRTVYYMRNSVGRVIQKIEGNDIGKVSLRQHLRHVMVRFGEDKKTRGEDVGNLILDEPSKVVKVVRKRIVQ